jgi:hypothetical protein
MCPRELRGKSSPIDIRPRDRFGIGVYHLRPSDNIPLPQLGVEEKTGFDVFYNAELWPGMNLTAHPKYIDSAFGNGTLVT